jgi:hypothetical protein
MGELLIVDIAATVYWRGTRQDEAERQLRRFAQLYRRIMYLMEARIAAFPV